MSGPGVDLLVRLLFDQEVFHQKILKELFEQTPLARTLGLWQGEKPPKVVYESDGGLFDLKLLGDGLNESLGIELKVNAFLGEGQEERQRKFAAQTKLRRAYILLSATYYCWRAKMPRADAQSLVIDPPKLASAIQDLLPDIKDAALSAVAAEYLQHLTRRASYAKTSYAKKPDEKWLAEDWNVFRFLDALGAHWPSEFEVYEMPHAGGYDRILNPRSPGGSDRRVLNAPTWFRVFWEIVSERIRFKVHVPSKPHRAAVRAMCRKAFHEAAHELGENYTAVGHLGEHMTICQLDLDIFGTVLDDKGQLVKEDALALYVRCERLLDAMLARLRGAAPTPALPGPTS